MKKQLVAGIAAAALGVSALGGFTAVLAQQPTPSTTPSTQASPTATPSTQTSPSPSDKGGTPSDRQNPSGDKSGENCPHDDSSDSSSGTSSPSRTVTLGL